MKKEEKRYLITNSTVDAALNSENWPKTLQGEIDRYNNSEFPDEDEQLSLYEVIFKFIGKGKIKNETKFVKNK